MTALEPIKNTLTNLILKEDVSDNNIEWIDSNPDWNVICEMDNLVTFHFSKHNLIGPLPNCSLPTKLEDFTLVFIYVYVGLFGCSLIQKK